jgi:uncharacterized lipoprotein YmbA
MKFLQAHFCLVFLICILSSCIVPESTHKESTFHLLTKTNYDQNNTITETSIEVDGANVDTVGTFYLRQIELPYYLQENRIITRPDHGKIEFRENQRWGEPLVEGIGRVLGLNLSHLLQSSFYSVYPHREKVGTRFEISLTIHRFERVSSSKVLFEGTWQLFTNDFKNGTYPITNGKEIVFVDIDISDSNEAIVDNEILALSETLSVVAKRVSIAIASLSSSD